MGYIENSLVNRENILYRANISWAAFIVPLLMCAFLIWISTKIAPFVVVLAVLFTIYVVLRVLVAILTTEFALTNRRIIAKRGVIRQHSIEILLNKVESISISQSLDGRIFGFGTVTVIGSGGTRESFGSISHPMELRKRVNEETAKYTPQNL